MFHDHRTRPSTRLSSLGQSRRGYRGRVQAIKVLPHHCDLPEGELERRLIELGFTEGARVEILYEGLFGRDPIAVRVDDSTVAIRRREAMAVVVEAFEAHDD
ncbi:MAG TPA: FeoA family protein [Rhodomicrobium sp.]|nr:FeoA family protein [Rhodomicrobium sp.]